MHENTERSMSDVRREAGEILSEGGNRLLLIEGIGICLLLVPMILFFGYAISALTELLVLSPAAAAAVVALYVLLFIALCIFVAGPLLFGLFYIAYRMVKREEVLLGDLFYAFESTQNYKYALRASAALVLRLCIAIIAVAVTYLAFLLVFPYDLGMMILCGVLITGEIIGGILACCSVYPLTCCILEGRHMEGTAGRRMERGLRFFGCFVPWILLGLLTVGVLLLWDTLPRMLVAYCCDCESTK